VAQVAVCSVINTKHINTVWAEQWCITWLVGFRGLRINGYYSCVVVVLFSWLESSSWSRHTRCWRFFNTDTPHSVGLHWKSDGPIAETSTWQQTLTIDFHSPDVIRTHTFRKRVVSNPRLRRRCHRDRPSVVLFETWLYLYAYRTIKYLCSTIFLLRLIRYINIIVGT